MVRLTGCNLRCVWCDTEYSFQGGTWLTIDEILGRVSNFPTRRVEITGGEPLLQAGTPELARRFLAGGYQVLCETSGERDIDLLPPQVKRIVDFKPPESGEHQRNLWSNVERLQRTDEVKFVIANRSDFDWMLGVIDAYALLDRAPVLVSPVHGRLEPRQVAAWILESGLDLRLNLQLHKYVWGAERGR
ncbi:MAG: radical SAM protein [Deltaproteobacteria bacterium]|nr:radical SAM protein [Deltaproteobacteria bacterium]